MSDLSLQSAIMEALADNPLVYADEISVQAVDGDVTLRGTVGSLVQRAEAARTTRGVAGVRTVDDQLGIRLLGIDGRTDADTEAAVLDTLIAEGVDMADVDVEVRSGIVTLDGRVEHRSDRDTLERIVLGVSGVSHVRNELEVQPVASPVEIAGAVTEAIGGLASVGADPVTVSVRDRHVTLTGDVSSREHRDVAVAAAKRAPGIVDVQDDLVIRPRPS